MTAKLPGHFVQALASYTPFANFCVAIGRSRVGREGLGPTGALREHRIRLRSCEPRLQPASRCDITRPRLPRLSRVPSLSGSSRHPGLSPSWMRRSRYGPVRIIAAWLGPGFEASVL